MIIDDGSTDNTKELVQSWENENKIAIHYIYQENQGMHGAHNTAYQNITTELNVCIDSDDFMPHVAIERIIQHWNNNKDPNIAGIVALDSYKDGKIIGNEIGRSIQSCTLSELYHKYKIKGDKKLIYRTEIVKKFPLYPLFSGERFVPLGTLYLMIDQQYKLLPLNEVVCIVEYLPDGSSLNIFKQYRKNPKGFAYSREVAMKLGFNFQQKFKNAIHYVATNIQMKKGSFIYKSPAIPLTLIALPFGVILYFYIRLKAND